MTEPPVIVLHLYTEKARTRILNRLKAEKRPEDTKIFLGTYGINELDAAAITAKAIPNVHYAPTFHLAPDENAALRAKRPRPPRRSPTLEQVFAGQLPAHPRDRRIPAKTPRAWGVELGRRFRDQLRQKELKLGPLDWQLDEIPPECGRGELAREFRLFIGGVIFGLAKGRPRLKDKPKPGFVWIAARALETLPRLPLTSDVKQFWQDVNLGARFLVGEEYPSFIRGAAVTTANTLAAHQRALARPGNPDRQALAARYIVGMTPGFHEPFDGGLNGNVNGMSLRDVTAWRNRYITARCKAQRPVGYGMFSFDGKFNTVPAHIDNAVTALCFAAKHHVKL